MYLQEIIIDGFKSYAQKTVVSGFDSQFNAITGLNGTGKSNILDAICFVLGINNLTQVRVGNLQELVYKQGQAGVTKATVTIIFNNSDPATSPVGYESHKQITVTRQVVIGGKNKYMVNGHTVQQSQVQNLFHSVQLNVNNPHFLIMQGRITKVLNMKPHETLGMIEEAAGTRMFETKKQASLKTIEKKQLKVDEITKCINEEITPTLENLRHERQDYHAWQSNNTEYERLERFCIACDYQTAETRVKSSETDKVNMLAQLEALNKDSEEQSKLAEQCNGQITEIARRRDEQMEGEMQEIKRTEAELSKEVVKINTLFTNHQESISGEESTLAKLAKQLISVEKSINDKNQALNQKTIEVNEKEQMMKDADANYMKMRETYHNACAGVADENTAELLSIPEQIVAWEKCERETSSKLQQCQQKQSHVNKTLTDLQKSNKSQSNTHNNMMKDMEKANKSIASKKSQYESISISSEQVINTKRMVQELQNTVSSLRDEVSGLEIGVNTRLQFDYQDPEPRFDRNRVKGCVARLFGISEARFATALEIVAGNKLTQVVVDNENTGKLLLQRGQLKKRVTILPLNKLAAKKVSEEKLSKVREIASSMKGSADLALNLISFNEDVRRAMEYVFGSVVICSSPQIAKTIAFDKSLRLRTVTMEGDSFDPSGTLTGGSNNQLGTLLKKVNDYRIAEVAYKSKSTELIQKEKELQTLDQQLLLKNQLGNELELAQQQLQSLQDALNETDYAQLMKQIEECQQELVTIQTEEKQLKELQSKASNELKTLGKAEKNAAKAREQKLKEFENQVKAAQKLAGSIKTEWMTLKTQKETIQAELKSLENEFKTIKEQQQVSQSALVRLQTDGQQMEQKLIKLRKEYDIAKEKVNQKSQELNLISQEIQELEKIKENHLKASQEATLEGRKLMHKIKQWDKEFKETTKVIQNLLKQHPWIEKEKQYFGQNGTDFDFSSKDIQQCYVRLKVLKSEQERLSKKINKKVMGMIENAESEYEDLTRKRQVILNDKSKIESVIQELDVKKQQALQKTWSQVNKDFGSIFSMLLPGTTAKLEPPEGSDVSEGLEVKVAFNGVWKESLTELSGGQRSLLALSLILALLLFKPAPMYILDEVDAALDLSHTQNIGMMIKTHFSASQFIVVSLKEGMFNNANVIFRTRFVDGVSAVTRTVAGSRGKAVNALALKDIEDEDFSSSTKADGSNEDDDIENLPKKKKGKTVSGSKKSSSDMKAPVAIDAI